MAWNPSPEVADCRAIALKWGCQQVVILGIDNERGIYKTASYGQTKALCDEAGKIMKVITDDMESGRLPP